MRSKNVFGFQFAANHQGIRQKLLDKYCLEQQAKHQGTGNFAPLDLSWIYELFEGAQPCQHFYVRSTVAIAAQLVQVKPELDFQWLIEHWDGLHQFNFGQSFIRVRKTGAIVFIVAAHTALIEDTHKVTLMPVHIQLDNLITGAMTYPEETTLRSIVDLYLQLMTFLCLGNIQQSELAPGKRYLSKKTPDGLYNDHSFPITIISSPPYDEYIRQSMVNWTLHHYPAPGTKYQRALEKRPRVAQPE